MLEWSASLPMWRDLLPCYPCDRLRYVPHDLIRSVLQVGSRFKPTQLTLGHMFFRAAEGKHLVQGI
jgi:hypothetical protein